jgi:hypothetical protein
VKVERFKFGLIPILLAFVVMLSIVFILPSVSAGGVTSTPGGTTIQVTSGQEFLLRNELYFDQPASAGYFYMDIYWDAPSSDENFVLENASAYWTSGPESGSPVENVQFDNSATLTGWSVNAYITSEDAVNIDGHFNVDFWLRAASADGTPHKENHNQLLYYDGGYASVIEENLSIVSINPVTIDVRGTLPPTEHTEFPWLPVAIAVVILVIAIIAALAVWVWRRPKGQKPPI